MTICKNTDAWFREGIGMEGHVKSSIFMTRDNFMILMTTAIRHEILYKPSPWRAAFRFIGNTQESPGHTPSRFHTVVNAASIPPHLLDKRVFCYTIESCKKEDE